MRTLAGALLFLGAFEAVAADASGFEIADASREAFSRLYAGVSPSIREQALRGRGLFRASWVIPPAADSDIVGLGPIYNQLSCLSCHPKNGRGKAPDTPEQAMRSMLVRLSVPGKGPHGGPLPVTAYGDQLNEQGIPGVPGEGRVSVSYSESEIKLAGGESVKLRMPAYRFTDLHYDPMPADALFSPRVGPPVFGMGLLEAVDEQTLIDLAGKAKPFGIQGRPNRVWDAEKRATVVGRFGLKANVATLKQQTAGAFIGDIGITSPLHPQENCTTVQVACRQAPTLQQPELNNERLESVLTYLRLLQVPARRRSDDPVVQTGEKIFTEIGCAVCHVPTLTTGDFPQMPVLAGQTIHPYSDLLLHDMGEGLADGRPDYEAGGRDWRTPPLWGIGLVGAINEHHQFLHDGRARNLTEAVLWHGGEAAASRQVFIDLPSAKREALLAFLRSL